MPKVRNLRNYLFGAAERPEIAISLIVLLLCGVRGNHFYRGSLENLVTVIPDDAFYAIVIADNRADIGRWTFDGVNSTTGIQFFFTKLLSLIFSLGVSSQDLKTLFAFIVSIASLSIGLSVYIIVRILRERFGTVTSVTGSIPFLGHIIISQSTTMLESWLAMLISALAIYIIFSDYWSIKISILCFGIGLVGSLTRTEFAILPFAFFIVAFCTRKKVATDVWRRSLLCLLGSLIANTFVLVSNLQSNGRFIPDSVLIKKHWSQIDSGDYLASIKLLSLTIFPSGVTTIANVPLRRIFWVAFLFYVLLRIFQIIISKKNPIEKTEKSLLFMGGLFSITIYMVLYSFNRTSLQPWYAATIICSVAIALGGGSYYLNFRSKWTMFSLFIIALSVSLNQINHGDWPNQKSSLRAAENLAFSGPDMPIASWNAGVLKYFSGKNIINIDGLVNSSVVPYIVSGNLESYLARENIQYIVDFTFMVTNEKAKVRGGYSSVFWEKCLQELRLMDDGVKGLNQTNTVLYKVKPECGTSTRK